MILITITTILYHAELTYDNSLLKTDWPFHKASYWLRKGYFVEIQTYFTIVWVKLFPPWWRDFF